MIYDGKIVDRFVSNFSPVMTNSLGCPLILLPIEFLTAMDLSIFYPIKIALLNFDNF